MSHKNYIITSRFIKFIYLNSLLKNEVIMFSNDTKGCNKIVKFKLYQKIWKRVYFCIRRSTNSGDSSPVEHYSSVEHSSSGGLFMGCMLKLADYELFEILKTCKLKFLGFSAYQCERMALVFIIRWIPMQIDVVSIWPSMQNLRV